MGQIKWVIVSMQKSLISCQIGYCSAEYDPMDTDYGHPSAFFPISQVSFEEFQGTVGSTICSNFVLIFFTKKLRFSYILQDFKWRILSQTSTEESDKNKKILFFLLGFKYTLRTCFEPKNFLPKSYPELSNQVVSFSEGQIYYGTLSI